MPTVTIHLNNVVLRDEFSNAIVSLLGSRPVKDPADWRWKYWHVTNPEGLEYQYEGQSSKPPLAVYFAGSQTADFSIVNFEGGSVPAYELILELKGGRGSLKVSAPERQVREWAAEAREALAAFVAEPERPPLPPFKVFIGHGGDGQWEYLERTLKEQGYEVENFEADDRAGFHTLVVIEKIIRSSAVAIIVMTGEDSMEDGSLRARENVVHEVGFAQGILGIENTIILLQEDVSEPSNIRGLTQIRFRRGRLIDAEEKILRSLNKRREAYDYDNL